MYISSTQEISWKPNYKIIK